MWPFAKRQSAPIEQTGDRPAPTSTGRTVVRRLRDYAAAAVNRLTNDWRAGHTTANLEIARALPILRNRARDLERNNDYIRRYLHLLTTNVVGHAGIGLQMRVKTARGLDDKRANDAIEAAWQEWCRDCAVDGQHSWLDVQHVAMRTVARDGELLLRIPPSWKGNRFGMAVKLLEADHLDVDYSEQLRDGGEVIMGVEYDRWRRPVAYHLFDQHPGENVSFSARQYRRRVPASEIIHLRRPERVGEARSVPWITCAAPRLRQIAAAEEAEVVAWRIAASKMGFYSPSIDAPEDFEGDDEAADGTPISEVQPGLLEKLPRGWTFQGFNPDKPASTVGSFLKAELRGIASGLNVSYVALANDLEGVSYSSIRSGENADRDNWRVLQSWLIQHLCLPVFTRWLQSAVLTAAIPYDPADVDRLNRPIWRPRGWEWVDPSNESAAAEADVRLGVESLYSIAAKRGHDLEEVFAANKQARELAASYGIPLPVFEPKEPAQKPIEDKPDV